MSIKIEASIGEFLDKLSILRIKSARISDPIKQDNINKELQSLQDVWAKSTYAGADIDAELAELQDINEKLWEIEDAIREKEASESFDEEFISLARSVYLVNDDRAEVKKRINQKLGSALMEEKSYSDYREK